MSRTTDEIELSVDAEFYQRLRPHSKKEDAAFRESVEHDGCFHDDIKYWSNGKKNLILDGHRRYEFWCSLPEDTIIPPPGVEEIKLPDRAAAKAWILRNQLGRRNLTKKDFDRFIGQLYNTEKQGQGRPKKTGQNDLFFSDTASESGGDTAEQIAAEHGTSASKVKREGAYQAALQEIQKKNPSLHQEIDTGKVSLPKKDVIAISKLDKAGVADARRNLKWGTPWHGGDPPKTTKPRKRKKPEELSPAKLVDKLIREHVSKLPKGIDAIAKKIGSKGPNYKAADDAINQLFEALKGNDKKKTTGMRGGNA